MEECSINALKNNIAELISKGHEKKQAIAIAYSVLKKSCGGSLPEGARNIYDSEIFATSKNPGPPPKEAIDFFKKKKIKPSFNYTDVWREEHKLAFTVAKMIELDLLQDVKDSIEDSLKSGTPFNEWSENIKQTFDKSGWTDYGNKNEEFRLQIIYETNMRMAYSAGQWKRIEESKALLPNLMYVLGPSKVHREEHETFEHLILPVDDPFWDTHMPPNGFGCKCGVIAMTPEDTKEWGGVGESPKDLSIGVDDGFDYNPGKDGMREKILKDQLKEKE